MFFKNKAKYNNHRTIINGFCFDSKLEGSFYRYLLSTKKFDIELQPRFLLQKRFVYNDRKIRPIEYVADFRLFYNGNSIIIDAKGVETPEFKIKAKLFKYKYPNEKFFVIKNLKTLKELISKI